MKKYKWIVKFTVDGKWVEDGFDMTEERAHIMLANTLPYACNSEICAKIIECPSRNSILKIQGYPIKK